MWRGFSFALHPLRVQGFYFALLQYSYIQSFTAVFISFMQLYHPHGKTAHRALHVLFLLFAVFCRRCCMAVHPAMPHYLRHAGAYHSTVTPPAHTRYQPPRRTLYRAAQPPYYNKVYKGAAVRPCYESMPDGAAHRRPCQPGGVLMFPTPGISLALCFLPGTAARNHWRLSPQLFSGFRPIANRGQQ